MSWAQTSMTIPQRYVDLLRGIQTFHHQALTVPTLTLQVKHLVLHFFSISFWILIKNIKI